jgi:hypothetical protein
VPTERPRHDTRRSGRVSDPYSESFTDHTLPYLGEVCLEALNRSFSDHEQTESENKMKTGKADAKLKERKDGSRKMKLGAVAFEFVRLGYQRRRARCLKCRYRTGSELPWL